MIETPLNEANMIENQLNENAPISFKSLHKANFNLPMTPATGIFLSTDAGSSSPQLD